MAVHSDSSIEECPRAETRHRGQVILASASPRRQQLLAAMGLAFTIMPTDSDESIQPGERPGEVVRRLSVAKAFAAREALLASQNTGSGREERKDNTCVIAADTIVVAPDGCTILGKPEDPQHARDMLLKLRNRQHDVYTGLALVAVEGDRCCVVAARTPVHMRAYSEAEIARYVASGDPMDKAGAYAIQHAHFSPIARLEGCYANVMGLPMCHLYRLLVTGYYGGSGRGNASQTSSWVRHPIECCPYALEHAGCPWASAILGREAPAQDGGAGEGEP